MVLAQGPQGLQRPSSRVHACACACGIRDPQVEFPNQKLFWPASGSGLGAGSQEDSGSLTVPLLGGTLGPHFQRDTDSHIIQSAHLNCAIQRGF